MAVCGVPPFREKKLQFVVGPSDYAVELDLHRVGPRAICRGDPGDGLDLEGVFQYAVDVAGPGGVIAGDAVFTNDQVGGITVTALR